MKLGHNFFVDDLILSAQLKNCTFLSFPSFPPLATYFFIIFYTWIFVIRFSCNSLLGLTPERNVYAAMKISLPFQWHRKDSFLHLEFISIYAAQRKVVYIEITRRYIWFHSFCFTASTFFFSSPLFVDGSWAAIHSNVIAISLTSFTSPAYLNATIAHLTLEKREQWRQSTKLCPLVFLAAIWIKRSFVR